ncbi:rhodanese-like domain-containing protein [Methylobrevis albus]|uniref:Rhodanese-like domain-containing protein n=1 Tax=Methylobrevis albus TaxID=2793297 RepID=A0A931MYR8_9HYPH|nr:rhodanese-like domain-containing protein [Methylobrevis albus]MBH0238732.1 rhodanese-like domain-containing protein [Methylobrevis albus]
MVEDRRPYAGDIDVADLWAQLQAGTGAVLVDVRTRAEWAFVGVPDLGSVGPAPVLAEWQRYPAMDRAPEFVAEVGAELDRRGAAPGSGTPVYFLCRSGARSAAAAAAMTAAGYGPCFNVTDGFEGPVGPDGHRGTVGGWKAAGLPWKQS